jgi:DNA damage-binding protein 1
MVKSIVYGGLDGIVTLYSIVAGVIGAENMVTTLLIVSISGLVADAIAMGVGDYVSERSEIQYAKAERDREEWETENYLEGERAEMVTIYKGKGLSENDAERAVDILIKNQELFVDTMMVEELGLLGWDAEDPWKLGLITLVSFCAFGAVPLLPYLVQYAAAGFTAVKVTLDLYFVVTTIMTMVTMYLLGVFAVCCAPAASPPTAVLTRTPALV